MNGEFRERLNRFRKEMAEYVDKYGCRTGLNLQNEEEVLQYVKDKKIDSVRLWFTDALGFLKSFSISPVELEKAFKEGMGFDGSSINGYARIQESDMVAIPIAKTAQLIPFMIGGSKAIRMFANIQKPDGTPFANDSRNILKRAISKLNLHGFTNIFIGPEAEFFYFKNDKSPELLDNAGYFDLNPVDVGDALREATVFALESMGVQVEYQHHEVAPSQHEIDLKYKDALRMADNLQTYKWLVKEVARYNNIHATFMPKPISGMNGSGMHVHISLFINNKNTFYSKDEKYHLSDIARKFIAGSLKHAPEICMITNQWSNSYKRLVPGYEAPVYIAWADKNRSALIRIPIYKTGLENAARIELRFPDAACNPYLAFSLIIAAGFKGIENDYELSDPINLDLYKLSLEERENLSIKQLPHDLYDAIMTAKNSELMKTILGEKFLNLLVNNKLKDYLGHRLYVSQKEIEDYMLL
ncbi:MAG: glutamine synthetase family protein [Candidatus Woesearchaeota archaeon]